MTEDVRRPQASDGDSWDNNHHNGVAEAYDSRRNGYALPHTSVNPINADRPVFTLSVAADLLGMHPRTLRIYEEESLVIPARTPTGRRRYSQNDIKRFQFIQHLTQRHKVNLAGVRIILDLIDQLDRCGVDYRPQLFGAVERTMVVELDSTLDDDEA